MLSANNLRDPYFDLLITIIFYSEFIARMFILDQAHVNIEKKIEEDRVYFIIEKRTGRFYTK